MARLIEPYQTHNLRNSTAEGAFSESGGMFSSRSLQIAKMCIEVRGGGPWSLKTPEGYLILNASDSVFFLCMKVTPDVQGYEIATYDEVTDGVKIVGYLPHHSYDSRNVYDNILGSLTEDRSFAVVLIQSTDNKSATVCVFDVANAICLLKKKCSEIGFLGCDLFDVTINPQAISQGQYRIAVLNKIENFNSKMGVRIWDPVILGERCLPLKCFWRIPGHMSPRTRGSMVKFSPAARFLCVLGDIWYNRRPNSTCLLMDPVLLEPLYMVEYGVNHWLRPMCNVFPTFSTSGLKFALFNWTVENTNDPRLLFFEIPLNSREMQTLKELCRYFILSLVIDDSKLIELPLPNTLIAYLTSVSPSFCYVCQEKQEEKVLEKKGKSCILM